MMIQSLVIRGVLFFLLLAMEAQARIPYKAYDNVTSYLHEDYRHLSPVFGATALDTGLIYNLRFYGNFEAGYKEDGTRHPIEDKPNDQTWNLVKLLFPSPAGGLGVETNHDANFGKYVTDPTLIANLLFYADELRYRNAYREDNVNDIENITVTKSDQKLIEDNVQLINDLLSKKGIKGKKLKTLTPTLNNLLKCIKDSIAEEKKEFYPTYTTEQIILAFFCEKFNGQQDIWDLYKALKKDYLDESKKIPEGEPLVNEESLVEIKERYDQTPDKRGLIDLFYMASLSHLFSQSIPYKNGVAPLSNGATKFYNRSTDELDPSKTFQDCAEIVLRHLFSMILFDAETNQYNLSHLEKDQAGNRYVKNLKAFFTKYTPAQANAGDIIIRSNWNKVVGDLNAQKAEDDPSVVYVKGTNEIESVRTNEIESGLVNMIRVMQRLTGVVLDPLPGENVQMMEGWVSTSLQTIFKKLNPRYDYQFDFKGSRLEGNELSSTIHIRALEKKTEIFSFNLYAKNGSHAEIKSIMDKKQEGGLKEYLKIYVSNLTKNSMEKSLTLLHEISDDTILYRLFTSPLADDNSRIRWVDYLSILSEDEFKNVTPTLKHVLDNMGWDDENVVERISESIFRLFDYMKNLSDEIKKTLFERTKAFVLDSPFAMSGFAEFIQNFTGLKSLEVREAHTNLKINDSVKLEKLYVRGESSIDEKTNLQSLKSLELDPFDNLSNFARFNLSNLELLKLKDLDSAMKKFFSDKGIKFSQSIGHNVSIGSKTLSFKNYPKSRTLELIQSRILEVLKIVENPHLNKVILQNMSFKKLTLTDLPALKDFNTYKLLIPLIEIRNCPQLDLASFEKLWNEELTLDIDQELFVKQKENLIALKKKKLLMKLLVDGVPQDEFNTVNDDDLAWYQWNRNERKLSPKEVERLARQRGLTEEEIEMFVRMA